MFLKWNLKQLLTIFGGFSAIGGVVFYLFNKSSKENQKTTTVQQISENQKSNRYVLSKAGLKLTGKDDTIWEKEFEKYKKISQVKNHTPDFGILWREIPLKGLVLNSPNELKNKCEQYLELDFEESKKEKFYHKNPLVFVLEFCIGKNKISEILDATSKLHNFSGRPLEFEKDEENWNKSLNALMRRRGEVYFPPNLNIDRYSMHDPHGINWWKETTKNFCKEIDWSKEKHELSFEKEVGLFLMVFPGCTNFVEKQKHSGNFHFVYNF